MNNQEYIIRDAGLTLANTEVLCNTAININILDANEVRKLVEEVVIQIEENTGEKFTNFNETVRLATPAVIVVAYQLQGGE